MPSRPYPAWRRRHDAILVYVIGHVGATQREIAAATGYTRSQVSRIMSSPDFTLRYEALMREVAFDARYALLTRRPAA